MGCCLSKFTLWVTIGYCRLQYMMLYRNRDRKYNIPKRKVIQPDVQGVPKDKERHLPSRNIYAKNSKYNISS